LRPIESRILEALSVGGDAHGYEIARRIGNGVEFAIGNRIYQTLRRLEAMEYLKSRWQTNGGPPRRVYTLTAKGKRAVKA